MAHQTFIYKTVDSVPVKLDFYAPASGQKNPPILLWYHGGGLLQGVRESVAPHMLHGASKHGYALISADYRLAPQVGVAEILEDVKDCIKFIRNDLSKHVDSSSIDTSRLAVSGSSAGGYLAFLAGLYVEPKPQVILPIYPITDPYGSFFTNPQPHPDGKVDRETVAPFLNTNAEVMSENEPESKRSKMYFWMMQEACLAELLHVKRGDNTFIIAEQIRKQGKTALPPTYVVHGDADHYVGVEQADEAVDAMKSVGIDHEYERPKGLDHLFDKDEKVTLDEMYGFMMKHV